MDWPGTSIADDCENIKSFPCSALCSLSKTQVFPVKGRGCPRISRLVLMGWSPRLIIIIVRFPSGFRAAKTSTFSTADDEYMSWLPAILIMEIGVPPPMQNVGEMLIW